MIQLANWMPFLATHPIPSRRCVGMLSASRLLAGRTTAAGESYFNVTVRLGVYHTHLFTEKTPPTQTFPKKSFDRKKNICSTPPMQTTTTIPSAVKMAGIASVIVLLFGALAMYLAAHPEIEFKVLESHGTVWIPIDNGVMIPVNY